MEENIVKFEITNGDESKPVSEIKVQQPEPRPVAEPEMESQRIERVSKLRDISLKISRNDEIEELEKQPAYLRRNVDISDTASSSSGQISKYSLHSDDESTGLKETNSFFDDVVD